MVQTNAPTVNSLSAFPDIIRSIDSATFSGAFQAVGTPTTRAIRIVKFVNNSNVLVSISWDGINVHDITPADSFALYDLTTNEVKPEGWFVREGTQFYVEGSAGVGLFYIVCIG